MNRAAWAVRLAARKARQGFLRNFYTDREPDPGRSVMVAGTARSGTTWLGDLIASELKGRIMFEPFHPGLVPEYAGYNYFQYMRPREGDEGLRDFAHRVFSGQIRNRWVDRQVGTLRPRWRVIKEVRACLLLRWLRERFPQVKMLFIIRNPCAVVSSRMKLGWATDGDIAPLLTQPKLLEDYLSPWLPLIDGADTDEEKHAVIWCVHNAVVLRQFADSRLPVVFFEEMTRNPRQVIPRVFAALGAEPSEAVYDVSGQPSMTSRGTSAIVRGEGSPADAWQNHLSGEQVERILRVVEGFGLGALYPPEGLRRDPLPPGIIGLSGTADRHEGGRLDLENPREHPEIVDR
jgi:hypothetical protein